MDSNSNKISRRHFLIGGATTTALATLGTLWQPGGEALAGVANSIPAASATPVRSPANGTDLLAIHLLRRTSYGIALPDLLRMIALGRNNYIEEQLNPLQIVDADCNRRLRAFPTLSLSNSRLAADYPMDGSDGKNIGTCMVELQRATIVRAVYSRRQLYEVMCDFWSNHFNIYQDKDNCGWYKTTDDRDVIRRHALGRFGDLLRASATSPAMLTYLDNAYSTTESVNENYGREILELHTLGVTGGYSQQDVRNVARAFTGWTVDWNDEEKRKASHQFYFEPTTHDMAEKQVLGRTLAAGRGIEDGWDVLNILINHPATRKHIATKLCRYLVTDEPPAGLIEQVAAAWGNEGDIKAMLRVLLNSSEFYRSAGQKLRPPFRYAATIVRTFGGDTDGAVLNDSMYSLDQPLFRHNGPTGYPTRTTEWLGASALFARWQFAQYILSQDLEGTRLPLPTLVEQWKPRDASEVVNRLSQLLVGGNPWGAANQQLIKIVGDDREVWPDTIPLCASVILSSPQFQLT